ncbi:MAG: cytidine deaminase [Planctomycetota bacterium]
MKAEELIAIAKKAREHAYAEYSKFYVGAALLTDDGRVFSGCNVENASYGLTICAERNAVAKAVSEGARRISAIAVVSGPGASMCGACRQVVSEFCDDATVYLADKSGAFRVTSVKELLPGSFKGEHLG